MLVYKTEFDRTAERTIMKIQNSPTPLVRRIDIMKIHTRRFIIGTATMLMGLFLATGCGVDHSPMAQDTQNGEGQTLLTFSSPQGAAKQLAGASETLVASGVIGSKGGKLEVEDKGKRGGKDDLKVTFSVPGKALEKDVKITMRVSGRYLSELMVAFEPSGLVFLKDAKLKIKLGKDLIDLDMKKMTGEHHYEDGHSEEAELKIDRGNITVRIPGFSRYSLGGRSR